jgi:large subunit ribosomal protein L18|tara:strand:- start:149 stop:502 length:354 start_codon:yes stop_codon:yes gene_type:complete
MTKQKQSIKRKLRTRKRLKNVTNIQYRVSVNKSLKNFSAQIIDDIKMKTIVSVSSIEKELKKDKLKKMETSNMLGEVLAKRAKEKKINSVYFDRGSYKYHGRVKIFADALRKNGLKF